MVCLVKQLYTKKLQHAKIHSECTYFRIWHVKWFRHIGEYILIVSELHCKPTHPCGRIVFCLSASASYCAPHNAKNANNRISYSSVLKIHMREVNTTYQAYRGIYLPWSILRHIVRQRNIQNETNKPIFWGKNWIYLCELPSTDMINVCFTIGV